MHSIDRSHSSYNNENIYKWESKLGNNSGDGSYIGVCSDCRDTSDSSNISELWDPSF